MPGRKSKKKRSKPPPDFLRKKQKIGKGKKVSENFSFKSKSVVVPCQWENPEKGGPTSNRKQGVQVLFGKVNHYNATVRQDALQGLRDIFQSHPDLLPKHLPRLVEDIFVTIVDDSGAVRKASHLLMEMLLGSVSDEVVCPFFETLMAHLNCGLTHIKEKIQLDSLKVLELYLKYCPSLLIPHVHSLHWVLLGLLSRHSPETTITPAGKSRSLFGLVGQGAGHSPILLNTSASDLLSKTTRLQVLKLISDLLNLLFPELQAFSSAGSFVGVAGPLVNILVESWVESHPEDIFQGKSCPAQCLLLMETVANVLGMLLKVLLILAEKSELEKAETRGAMVECCKKITEDVSSHFLHHFPFGRAKLKFLAMNFTFCEISLLLWRFSFLIGAKVTDSSRIMQYLNGLNSSDIDAALQLSTCSKIVASLTSLAYSYSLTCSNVEASLVGGVFKFIRDFYFACHPRSKSKLLLVKCLCSIFLEELKRLQSDSLAMTTLLLPWSNSLLDLLVDIGRSSPDIASLILDSIAAGAMQGNTALISQLQQKLLPFLETGAVQEFSDETQRKLLELVWHLPIMNEEDVSILSKLVVTGEALCVSVVQYLIQIVHHKYTKEDLDKTLLVCTPPYLSFMLTILIGRSTNLVEDSIEQKACIPIARKSNLSLSCEEYTAIHQTVSDCLKASPVSADVLSCCEESLLRLKRSCCLPVNSLFGILTVGYSCGPLVEGKVSTDLIIWFAHLCVSSMWAHSSVQEMTEGTQSLWSDMESRTQRRLSEGVGVMHCGHLPSCDERLLDSCLKLSSQIVRMSPAVLASVIHLLSELITVPHLTGFCEQSLIMMLKDHDLYPVLWKIRNRIGGSLQNSLGDLSSVPIKKELELAAAIFLSN